MKQMDLAASLGVTQAYVSKYLKGKRGCSLQTAKKLSAMFGHDPIWWMESTPEQRRSVLANGNGHKKEG
jgi:plasmid maintenance system antidote protein VapI